MKPYEKLFLASLGLLNVSAKEARQLLKNISGKKISEKEFLKTFAALVKEGKMKEHESIKKIKAMTQKILKELDVPTRNEFNALKKKVNTPNK